MWTVFGIYVHLIIVYPIYMFCDSVIFRAVETPYLTCLTSCPISLRTSKNWNLLVLEQGLYSSSQEECPNYEIYILFLFLKENQAFLMSTHNIWQKNVHNTNCLED